MPPVSPHPMNQQGSPFFSFLFYFLTVASSYHSKLPLVGALEGELQRGPSTPIGFVCRSLADRGLPVDNDGGYNRRRSSWHLAWRRRDMKKSMVTRASLSSRLIARNLWICFVYGFRQWLLFCFFLFRFDLKLVNLRFDYTSASRCPLPLFRAGLRQNMMIKRKCPSR